VAGAFVNNSPRACADAKATPRCRHQLPDGKAARPEWKETAPPGTIKRPPAGAKKRKDSGGM
jgi:hypothetical protein